MDRSTTRLMAGYTQPPMTRPSYLVAIGDMIWLLALSISASSTWH
jgi:hypothetical protein